MRKQMDLVNYRGFKNFRMRDFTSVNLIVGKNNSGKTAVLEAVQLLASGVDPSVIAEIVNRRGEHGRTSREQQDRSSTSIDVSHLFYGHSLTSGQELSIRDDFYKVTVTIKQSTERENDIDRRRSRSNNRTGLYLQIQKTNLSDEYTDSFMFPTDPLVEFDIPLRVSRSQSSPFRGEGPYTRFVGSDSISIFNMAEMWDEITYSGQEEEISNAMRILEPEIESVHFLTGFSSTQNTPFPESRPGIVVGLSDRKDRIPIGSLGDGMRRMMGLATSLTLSKAGCLLVDEIDTGLHYSVMKEMWKMIIEKSIDTDTQVFATTHSWDCVEGLCCLCDDDPMIRSNVSIHKIDRDFPQSISFSGTELPRLAKSSIDPR